MRLYKNNIADIEFLYSQEEPLVLFDKWYKLAADFELNDPNAMSLATACSRGMPDVRIVLLKGYGEKGFRFFTNYESKKADDLHHNPYICLNFHWKSLQRQVRLKGVAEKLSADESDEYFLKRPYDNQISAWSSFQSSAMDENDDFDRRVEHFSKSFEKHKVKRPPFWGGYNFVAFMMEFWIGSDSRRHDRIIFDRDANDMKKNQKWHKRKFYP